MATVYDIEKGNWINDEPITLTVHNDEEASTQHYDMEIEWVDDPVVFDDEGVGYVNGREVATIYQDGRWFYAKERHGDTQRDSNQDPFIALAHLAYTIGIGW